MSYEVPTWVAELIGATPRQVDYWTRARVIDTDHPGPGYRREWNERTLLQAGLVKALLDAGATLMRVREVLAVVDDIETTEAILVLDHERTSVASTPDEVRALLADSYGCVTVLAIDTILRPILARIERLRALSQGAA